jgi:hypothetical protein
MEPEAMIDRRKNSAEHRPQAQALIGIVVAACDHYAAAFGA